MKRSTEVWLPIAVLAAAQFVMVLDSSVMNVSISQIVADLDTTIQGVQLAITAYTLVMAAFMLAGAKLGDILGRDRTFAIGLAIYGLGSLTTALSPNLAVLLVGWSLVEGIGAALVMPAIVSLDRRDLRGQAARARVRRHRRRRRRGDRGRPADRRLGHDRVQLALRVRRRDRDRRRDPARPPPAEARRRGSSTRPKLDVVGVALSSLGLGLAVFGILKSSEWGWIEPLGALTIGGEEITPFGFSVVPFLILAGVGCLGAFATWEERRERPGRDTLLDRSLLRIEPLRAGLTTLMMQQLILLGTFFVLPVYLQVVLGLDAFETGKRLFPMSVTMFIAALAGPRLAARPRPEARRAGGTGRARGGVAPPARHDRRRARRHRRSRSRWRCSGSAPACCSRQLGNVIMSSVDPAKINEAGGLQGTAQNLGASLGTALIGSVLIAALTSGFVERVEQNPAIPPDVRAAGRRSGAEGHPRRARRGRRAGGARRGRSGRAGRGDRRRLRRRAARRAQARDRRGRDLRPALAVVHAAPAGAVAAGSRSYR